MGEVKGTVDPTQPRYHGTPLWCVSGSGGFPQIFCCKVVEPPQCGLTIWGYSEWKNVPAFRTLGASLTVWMKANDNAVFFADKWKALEHIATLVTPRKGAK